MEREREAEIAANQAKKELRETQKAFEAVREKLQAQMLKVSNEQGAYRVAMSLQALDMVKAQLISVAQEGELIAHDKLMSDFIES